MKEKNATNEVRITGETERKNHNQLLRDGGIPTRSAPTVKRSNKKCVVQEPIVAQKEGENDSRIQRLRERPEQKRLNLESIEEKLNKGKKKMGSVVDNDVKERGAAFAAVGAGRVTRERGINQRAYTPKEPWEKSRKTSMAKLASKPSCRRKKVKLL